MILYDLADCADGNQSC